MRERPRVTWLNTEFDIQIFAPLYLNNCSSDLDGVFTEIFGAVTNYKVIRLNKCSEFNFSRKFMSRHSCPICSVMF